MVAHACNLSILRGSLIMRSRDQDHPGQHGENPSLLKIQKLGLVVTTCGPELRRLRQENCLNLGGEGAGS